MDIQRIRNITTRHLHTGTIHDMMEDLTKIIGIPVSFSIQVPMIVNAIEPILRVRITDDRFWDGQCDPSHTGELEIAPFSQMEREEAVRRFQEQPAPEAPESFKNNLFCDILMYLQGKYYGGFHYMEALPVLITLMLVHGKLELQEIDPAAADVAEQHNAQVARLRGEVAKTLLTMYMQWVGPEGRFSLTDLFLMTLGYKEKPEAFQKAIMGETSFEENSFFFTLIEGLKTIPLPKEAAYDEYVSMQVASIVQPYQAQREMEEMLASAQRNDMAEEDGSVTESMTNHQTGETSETTYVAEPAETSTVVAEETSTPQ